MKRTLGAVAAILCLVFFSISCFAGDGSPRQVQVAVREYIETNMPWPPGTARIEFLSDGAKTMPQSRNTAIRIEPIGNEEFIGDMAFLVRVLDNGRLLHSETIRTRIEVYRDTVVTARTLTAGVILTEADVRTVRKWVRRIHPQAIASTKEAVGKRLSTQIRAGTEISSYMLKDVPMVLRGKIVKVIFDNGPMRIVTVGLSEEDGMAGSIVRVKNLTSNKIMYARVLGDSLVGIEI
jgi:flagellar basal body P-ring formation protein FlgA